jgi:hypothetical protein
VPPPPPPTNGAAHKPPAGAASQQPDIGWDDEELATNIYAQATDASDSVVDDKPDLSGVELSADGKPVPHSSLSGQVPALDPPTSKQISLPTNGAHSSYNGFGGAAVPGEPTRTETQAPSSRSLWIALCLVGAVLCGAAAGGWIYFGNRPGELMLTSEPAANVQVLIDNKRMAVDGTPATLTLPPGSYALTVQREGYVPYSEQIDIQARGRLSRHVPLEPLASGTGFTLSEPAGAQVYLDGKLLESVSPLQVQSVTPGKHHIEVKAREGGWSDDVMLERGKMTEVHAVLKGTAPKTAEPSPPKEAAKEVAHKPEPKADRPTPKADRPAPKPDRPAIAEVRGPKDRPVAVVAEERDRPRVPVAAKKTTPSPQESDTPSMARASTPPAGGGEGYLRLGSKPWTNIAVDGKDTGLHTPQTRLKLNAGSHRITLSNPQFGVKETFNVDIAAGATETVIKDLRPAGAAANSDD